MNNLLQHPEFGEIRINKTGDNIIYCAKDLCNALDMVQAAESALRNLDEDEKLMRKIYTSGQRRDVLFVTESGMYALIIRSNKPVARKFRKWVTVEVLPSLRKYGIYTTDAAAMERAKKRAETRAKKDLFQEIDRNISTTDKKLIAKQCLTTEYDVNRVLAVDKEDVYMATQLFGRAMGNKELHASFYTKKGAEDMLKTLLNHKRV